MLDPPLQVQTHVDTVARNHNEARRLFNIRASHLTMGMPAPQPKLRSQFVSVSLAGMLWLSITRSVLLLGSRHPDVYGLLETEVCCGTYRAEAEW